MLLDLPVEVSFMIAQLLLPQYQASLAKCSWKLYQVCSAILFKCDIEKFGSSSTFYAIAICQDDQTSLTILRAASRYGANFEHCRDLWSHQLEFSCSSRLVFHSPILLAAGYGRTRILEFLLDQNIPIDGPQGYQVTPLFMAIQHRKPEAARVLIERGAALDPPQVNMSALQYSVWYAVPYLVLYLIDQHKGDITQRTHSGDCCLRLALASPQPARMANLLLELGYDVSGSIARYCAEEEWDLLLRLFRLTIHRLPRLLPLGHCLAWIENVSLTKVLQSEQGNHRTVLRYLIVLSVSAAFATGKRQTIALLEADAYLEEVLARTLSIDNARLGAAEVLLQHNVRVRSTTTADLLAIVRSREFAEDAQTVLRKHKHLLKILDFFLTPSSRRNVDNSVMDKFRGDVPEGVRELLRNMKQHKVPLTLYGLRKLLRLQEAD